MYGICPYIYHKNQPNVGIISGPWMVWDLKRQVLCLFISTSIGTSRSAAKARLGSEFWLCLMNPLCQHVHQLKTEGDQGIGKKHKKCLRKQNGHYKMGPFPAYFVGL